MKITKRQLQRLIREEVEHLKEEGVLGRMMSTMPGTVRETYSDNPLYMEIQSISTEASNTGLPLAAALDAVKRAYKK